MNASKFCWKTLGALVSIVVIAGCAGASQSSLSPVARTENRWRVDHGSSWMSPEAKKADLLYVSDDGTFDVYVYSYPAGKLEGTLTGFHEPGGLCVDETGDIFITNTGDSSVLEYAHGGTSPIATLADSGQKPQGCSVDPTTGNLAVTSVSGTAYESGNVAIYKGATGEPTSYTDPNIYYYYFCAYGPNGNLYVDGESYSFSGSAFARLDPSSGKFKVITLDQPIGYPGGVQWNEDDLAVGDQDASVIYQFAINEGKGTKVGSTPLTGSTDVIQFWIQGSTVIGPDYDNADVSYWRYPSGGEPTKVISGLDSPIGSVVSKATK
jgi:hypothetical protein